MLARASGEADAVPLVADVFPGDAVDGADSVGTDAPTQVEGERYRLRVLGEFSALMGFGSISMGWVIVVAGLGCSACARLLLPAPAGQAMPTAGRPATWRCCSGGSAAAPHERWNR